MPVMDGYTATKEIRKWEAEDQRTDGQIDRDRRQRTEDKDQRTEAEKRKMR